MTATAAKKATRRWRAKIGPPKVATPKVEEVEEDEIILEEQEVKKPASDYASVNALVEALDARKKNN